MPRTKIEWVKNPDGSQGYSWNPLRGTIGKWHCTKISPGCANCYAERVNHRFGGPAYTVGADTIRLDEKVLAEPLRWRKPRMVFVCSMTDLFHEDVHYDWQYQIFDMMAAHPQHTFQVLTKRPEIALERIPALCGRHDGWKMPLPNVWLGVSCENQEMADKRIPILLQIPAAVRWVSAEPLLGPIDLIRCRAIERDSVGDPTPGTGESFTRGCIDWLVVGSESGPGRRDTDLSWVRSLRDQASVAGVPLFLKQLHENGKKISTPEIDGKQWKEFPIGHSA